MGYRFKKSVKICKGVRVNFSKSGASLSLGGRGHSVNISNHGARATVGLPGTGISYSTRVSGSSTGSKNLSNRKTSSSSKSQVIVPSDIRLQMDDMGRVTIIDINGNEIHDASVIKKIKATSQYKSGIEVLDAQRKRKNEKYYEDSKSENERFINIYQLTPQVDSLLDFEERLNNIHPEEYKGHKFTIPSPTETTIRSALTTEAEHNVKGSIFKISKLRKQYVENNIVERLAQAVAEWEKEKSAFLEQEAKDKSEFEQNAKAESASKIEFLKSLIEGNAESVSSVFDEWIATCELPVEININYDWNSESGTMLLDVDLPEIEDLPPTKLIKTDTGNLKEKNKTQTELRNEYAILVFGLAIFISANAFNVSPAVKRILVSGFTQRRNKIGDINDDYIYSIKFSREAFEHRSFSTINPQDFCFAAENRCNISTTSIFRVIHPFDSF